MGSEVDSYLTEANFQLATPDDFAFPFPPYDIQEKFMSQLYSALEEGKLGIFESPTGTGKSLSLICGALSWLKDHENRVLSQLEATLNRVDSERSALNDNVDDWLSVQVKQMALTNARNNIKHRIEQIVKDKERISEIRNRTKENKGKGRSRNNLSVNKDEIDIPDEVDLLLDTDDYEDEHDEDEKERNHDSATKIIFCSRTHSQLAQFIGEIQRTIFAETMRVVPMGSRQNCCINSSVKKLKNIGLINEKCLELLKSSTKQKVDDDGKVTKKSKGSRNCPFIKNVDSLKETIISQVMDLEDIVAKGESLSACPYYSTRASTTDSQIIVAPYNLLLHKSTRESSNLNIKNAVVIIDEAHNLLETVSHIHSSEVTGQMLTSAHNQLTQYKFRYEKLFNSTNLLYLNQLIFVLKSLLKFIKNSANNTDDTSNLFTVSDFILSVGIDNYNLFKLVDFCSKRKLAHKLKQFNDQHPNVKVQASNTNKPPASGMKSFLQNVADKNKKKTTLQNVEVIAKAVDDKGEGQPLLPVLSFLNNLTMDFKEGRVVVSRNDVVGKAKVKYLLLDPTSVMRDIIQNARSVILAGGTMKPFSEFRDRLFLACGADESRIVEFSCGHVIPKENILPLIVCSGPTGKTFDFSFNNRNDAGLIEEIGRLLVNICSVIPAGIVCFFPSYEYENLVFNKLKSGGFLDRLSNKKKIFREPKLSSEVEGVLKEYSSAAQMKPGGALLFSVVGGKLSEGLNFSDDLGRCVVVVGLPYPNIKSTELKEKMNYLDQTVGSRAGRDYYENCCMKAVNQCIGRAVRHRNDYSTVILLDRRFNSSNHLQLLPQWIATSLKINEKFGPALCSLARFFKERQ